MNKYHEVTGFKQKCIQKRFILKVILN